MAHEFTHDLSWLLGDDSNKQSVEQRMRELLMGDGVCPDALAEIGAYALSTGGKRLRARLALAATMALSLDNTTSAQSAGHTAGHAAGHASVHTAMQNAVDWAAACELLHNATLIHDDIEDGDTMRRGQPTVWQKYGVAQGINAGDLLLMLPTLAVDRMEIEPARKWYLSKSLAACATALARGQADEFLLPSHIETHSIEHVAACYLSCIARKTGALFTLPVEGAALLANLDPNEAAEIGRSVAALGLLFQMQDDVLDLYGDKGRGEIGADIKEGKISAIVINFCQDVHQEHPEQQQWLLNILKKPRNETTDAEVKAAIDAMRVRALPKTVEHMRQLGDDLANTPCLLRYPRLHRLVLDMRHLVLAPIQHVLA